MRKISTLKKHSNKTFFVVDVETGKRTKKGVEYFLSGRPEHFIFAVLMCSNGSYQLFEDRDDLIKEFQKKKYKNKIIFAHNGEYDFSCIFDNIYKVDKEAIFNGKFISFTNGNCIFADSLNLLPASVLKIGDMLGKPKLKLQGKSIQNDIDYCVRDCEIIVDGLKMMFEFSTKPVLTIGGLALNNFKQHLKFPIRISEVSNKFFECYYGGRTEAFFVGECEANVYDLNSAYPYEMQRQRYPDPSIILKCSPERFADLINSEYCGMVTATVTIYDKTKIPPLPVRDEKTKKLIFPVGTFTGSWTLHEFRNALQDIDTYNIHEIYYSPRFVCPFVDFINFFWNERTKTTGIYNYICKLIPNNLYGKFAQRRADKFIFCDSEAEAIQKMKQHNIKRAELIEVHGGYFLQSKQDKIYQHTCAPWASYITSYVRINLLNKMREYADKVIYCDTDSIFLSGTMKVSKLEAKELGGWKKENKEVVKINGLKNYIYFDENKVKHHKLKGVRKGAEYLGCGIYRYKKMIRTRESFARKKYIPPGTFIDQTKKISGRYEKRIVYKNGETAPIKL